MDKRKSILNVSVSIGFRLATIVASIVTKRFLIQICGNDMNGLNALYQSILELLSVAELGVGTAITFCMYKPIVEGDNDTVSALYHLFRKIYLLIGGIIFAVGLAITPFLRFFAKDYAALNVNLHITFLLMLVSVVISYLFGAQMSLFNAYKNNYIATALYSGGLIVRYVLQIVVLLQTRSFVGFIICRILAVVLQWGLTAILARKDYGTILMNRQKLEKDTQKELVKNIRAMFMHKVGMLMETTTGSVVISMFIGVAMLGRYSNYALIMTSMLSVIKLVFTSLTSIWGHLYAEKSKDTVQSYCEAGHLLNFWIGTLFFLGYYAIADNLVAILFSADLMVAKSISFAIALNGFVQYIRENTLAFRDATGTFYNDRWKSLVESIVNVVLSVIFVKRYGVTGVVLATLITNLVICHVVEPYVLYKYAFASSPRRYYWKNYGMIIAFAGALLLLDKCLQSYGSQWKELLVNGCISVVITAAISVAVIPFNKNEFRYAIKIVKEK